MRACRALVLRCDITRPPEAQQKVAGFLKVREGFRRWVSKRARSNGEMQAPEQNPLKYFAQKSVWSAGEWLREQVTAEVAGSRRR
jgi:hypothetical protein